jgi:hypothetical protein|tara:strand:- start:10954 stop:12234 length:1281 start_codon:yes stop_codon:yes gene_type:complete
MASEKYFLFRTENITEFSEVFSDSGSNLSMLSISTDQVAYITAKQGSVVVVFNNAGLYETFQGTSREALTKTRMEISCDVGQELRLVRKITEFITNPSPVRRVLEFDAVTSSSSFKESKPATLKPLLPKFPVVMATQEISDDPASIDLTQTTTTTIADITFPAPSLMPIIDYNETGLAALGVNDQVGAANNWVNAGTGGATFNITNDTGTPDVQRDNGIMGGTDLAVQFATSEDLHLANALEVEGSYTAYMVIGTTGPYSVFGGSIFAHSTQGTYIGFGATVGTTDPKPNEFHVNHAIGTTYRKAFVNTNNTDFDTQQYKIPDPLLDNQDVNTVTFDGQQTYVFVLRRDKDNNLYLHNHLGVIVGFIPKQEEVGNFRTSGLLAIDRIGGGAFRHNIARVGVITTDIGGGAAKKLAIDLHEKYKFSP